MTKIEWTDRTWNPVTGCTKVSPACANCYADRMATRLRGRVGYDAEEPFRVTYRQDRLIEPLRRRKPSRFFVCSMADLFHEDVSDEALDEIFGVMALSAFVRPCRRRDCEHEGGCRLGPLLGHTFQVLTKRPERAREYLSAEDRLDWVLDGSGATWAVAENALDDATWPLPNVWVGVSAEDQQRADERIPILLDTPAAVRFVSCEPLLGPINLREIDPQDDWHVDALDTPDPSCRLDWVIAGGESGPGARAPHPNWFRSLRDQCQSAGVPFFFKQWGEWAYLGDIMREEWIQNGGDPEHVKHDPCRMQKIGKSKAGRYLDGRTWDELPKPLSLQETP